MKICELNKLIKEILIKEISSYEPSKNPSVEMADFYMLTYLVTSNLDTESKSFQGSFVGSDDDNIEEIKSFIKDAENKILSDLKEKHLRDVYISIACEMSHVMDYISGYATKKEIGKFYKSIKNNNELNYLKTIKRSYLKPDYDDDKLYIYSYEKSKEYFKNEADFVEFSKRMFELNIWFGDFGGELWSQICDGWLRLRNTRTRQDLYVAIDHIYDLQHNTGSVFTKIGRYSKPNYDDSNGYDWIKNFLDFKRYIKNIRELIPYCSGWMKKFSTKVLKILNIPELEKYDQKKDNIKSGNPRNYKYKKSDFSYIDVRTEFSKIIKYTFKGIGVWSKTFKNVGINTYKHDVSDNGLYDLSYELYFVDKNHDTVTFNIDYDYDSGIWSFDYDVSGQLVNPNLQNIKDENLYNGLKKIKNMLKTYDEL